MPHSASSDMVLHCLPTFHKRDAMVISVKYVFFVFFWGGGGGGIFACASFIV